jgi:hypothetical protein
MHGTLAFSPDSISSPETDEQGAVSRPRYVILQLLVAIMLGYQLLFGPELVVSRAASEFIVGGLVVLIGCLLAVPSSVLQAAWFTYRGRYGPGDGHDVFVGTG